MKIFIPDKHELTALGGLDPSDEAANYAAPGCQHKYPRTALIMVIRFCEGYCRFYFSKRLFVNDNDEIAEDYTTAIDYIAFQPQITSVLLTGGDPLLLPTPRFVELIRRLREIDHVQIIRIGTKMPAFNPMRIIDDSELQALVSRYSTRRK